jgi:D-alanyl-D-alanine carboxypeptidase/D-alanyl-D-alanine-endopeptidase (penicillin-binding protein 4)
MVRHERRVVFTLALLQVLVVATGSYVITRDSGGAPAPAASPEPTPAPIASAGSVLTAVGEGPLPAKSTLTAKLTDAMGDPALGDHVAGVVLDAETGSTLFDGRATTGLTPASTTKIVTAVAVLTSVGPDARFATKVVKGTGKNSIVLVGGGDPTLAGPKAAKDPAYPRPASLDQLALRTARALKAAKTTSVALSYDASLFTGPTTAPGWKPTYIPEGSVAAVTALAIDGGRSSPDERARVADPSRAAAAAFAALLRKHGIAVAPSVKPVRTKATARELTRVESPAVYQLVERMLTDSDNDVAEALARQVAIKEGLPSTFTGQAKAVQRVLSRLRLAEGVEVYDGSGLSTRNRITPAALARLLAAAASPANARLHSLVSGMPVAGFTGTLHGRYDKRDSRVGAGLVRAKTGSLTGVNTLAGVAHTADGRLLAFAFMADDVGDSTRAVTALDRMAALICAS